MTKEEFRKHCSAAGKLSRVLENKRAKQISKKFSLMFQPFEVCDRICIKDRKIVFVEIKKVGQRLSHKQLIFRSLCDELGYQYIVEYI